MTVAARITNKAGAHYRLGVDIGGTFTDIVLVAPNGQIYNKKVSSTEDDYARGILEGIEKVLVAFGLTDVNITEVTQGTTVA